VQPEDTEVVYPAGTSFHVEVDNPDAVVAYQWIASDGVKPFVLDGETAHTDTLIIPSVSQTSGDLQFVCQITDNQGNVIYSNPATLFVSNWDENKPVLYVGEYALEPGDTLDLETTTLGEGIVRYDANGVDITFEGVSANVKYPIFDSTLAPSMGIMFTCVDDYVQEYRFHFLGNCVFINPYFDSQRNAGGVVFNSFFACGQDPNKPTIIMDGGTLTLIGGGNQIYSDANLEFNLDVKTVPNAAIFCDGIRGGSIVVGKNANLQLGVNGTAIHTEGDLWLEEGAKVDIVSFGPHVSVGPTTKNILWIRGSVYAKGADLNIHAIGDANQYHVYGNYLAVWYGIYLAGEGSVNLDNSRVNILLESIRGVDIFGVNWGGITAEGNTNSLSLENDSLVTVSGKLPNVIAANGVYMGGIVSVDATSTLDIDLECDGEVFGIVAERALVVKDGTVSVRTKTNGASKAYGIICGELQAELTEDGSIHAMAEDGLAIGADTGIVVTDGSGSGWNPEYVVERMKLEGKAAILTPEDAGISPWGVPYMGNMKLVETVFDKSATSQPADDVLIGVKGVLGGELLGGVSEAGKTGSWPLILVGALVVLGAAVALAKLAGGKKE
ncbi:MAG: hypothetical protein IKF96_07785, partial [Eggerthellaceae bacterium]|nr:hypothetical protein [Eggerthellaceae bacterium]